MKVSTIDQTGGAPGTFVHKINVVAADLGDNSEVDTGLDLGATDIVEDVYLYVNTAEATATTKTLDVGLLSSESGGDANGFLAAASVASTGIVEATLADGAATMGALLYVDESAGDLVPERHAADSVTAKSISVSFGDAGGANELDVDIYILCRHATVVG